MILEIVADLGYLLLLINTLFFSIGFSKKGRAYRIFTSYLWTICLIQVVVKLLHFLNFNNLYLSHFYFILQFVILSFFYLNLQFEDFQKKMIKIGFVFCLLALAFQYTLDTSVFFEFNLFEIFITSFLLIVYATVHLYNLLNEKKEFYYVNVGILIYLFGSTILFLSGNLMIYLSPKLNKITWLLNAFLYVIYQLLILLEWKKSFYKKNNT